MKSSLSLIYNKADLERTAIAYGLRFIVLHGSYATGKARPDSDVDIAAWSNATLSFREKLSLYTEISAIFENEAVRDVDFKMLNGTDPLFRYQVVRDGVLLCGNLTDYEEYKAVTYRMYQDAQPLRDLENILARRYQDHLRQYYA